MTNLPVLSGESSSADLVKILYKDSDDEPIQLSPTQEEIFDCIFKKTEERVQVMTPTQWGKSMTVALAILTRASTFAEKWAIVAPTEEKAKIIMGYIIKHAFDNDYTKNKLALDSNESMDRIRRERSKKRLTFKVGDGQISEIFVVSADSKNKAEAGNSLMGFGAPNVVLDEAALIDDVSNAKIIRMLGGASTKRTFLMKIGNPFKRNHFYRTHNSPRYKKYSIDWRDALSEGRYTQDFIDEMKEEPLFDVLYECKFPTGESVDDDNWASLLTYDEIQGAMAGHDYPAYGTGRLGCDVADSGIDTSSIVHRCENFAKIIFEDPKIDTMEFAGRVILAMREEETSDRNTAVDKTGVGVGICQRLREQKKKIYQFVAAGKAFNEKMFENRRAEIYWALRKWIKNGGKLLRDNRWYELCHLRYRVKESNGRIQLMSKLDMKKKDGVKSPNIADALAMTFAKAPTEENAQKSFETMLKLKKKKALGRSSSGYAFTTIPH